MRANKSNMCRMHIQQKYSVLALVTLKQNARSLHMYNPYDNSMMTVLGCHPYLNHAMKATEAKTHTASFG